jgi:hypothetical protein
MLSAEDTMHEMTLGIFYSRVVKISIEGMTVFFLVFAESERIVEMPNKLKRKKLEILFDRLELRISNLRIPIVA